MSLFDRTSRIIRANNGRQNNGNQSWIDQQETLLKTGMDLKRSIHEALLSQQKLNTELQRLVNQAEALITQAKYEKYHGNINIAQVCLIKKNELLKQGPVLREQIKQYELTLTVLRESLAKIEKCIGEIPTPQLSIDELECR